MIEKRTRDSLPTAVGLDKYGANIRLKVGSVVKIVFYYAKTADDPPAFKGNIPLGNCGFARKALLHALKIRFFRNTPFRMKPVSCRFL